MSTAETAAAPRPRFDAPGGPRLLTRGALARMLAQLHAAAQPRLQVEGAELATGASIVFPPESEDLRENQAALQLRARALQALIPGRGRLITKDAFATALRSTLAALQIPLDIDGAEKLMEDADGGASLRLSRKKYNVYLFLQIEIFDNVSGDTDRDIALGGTWTPDTGILTTTSEWEFTQMLELPEADPPRSRTIRVTYFVRFRLIGTAGTPTWGDPDLLYLGPVEIAVKKYNRTTSSIDTTSTVLIDDPGGVTRSYSTTAARSGDELLATALAVL